MNASGVSLFPVPKFWLSLLGNLSLPKQGGNEKKIGWTNVGESLFDSWIGNEWILSSLVQAVYKIVRRKTIFVAT